MSNKIELPAPQKPHKKSSSKSKQKPRPESPHNSVQKDRQKKNLLFQKTRQNKENKENKNRKNAPQHRLTLKVDKYQIDLESVLGRGTFGQVYKAHLLERPDQVFACKLISKSRLEKQKIYEQSNTKSIIDRLESEIETMKSLSECKYVVKLFDFVKVQQDGYYLFMEMCDIDVGRLIKERGSLPENQALDLFKQLLKGYKYLYDHGISHRDLKPQNLLLQGRNLKISDFGFVKVHTSTEIALRSAQKGLCLAQSLVGSINYIAPDILLAQKQKTKYNPILSDVWSMGIILYKMIYGKEPYQAYETSQLLNKIMKEPLVFPGKPEISEHTMKLMKRLIEKDVNLRPTFKEIFLEEVGDDVDVREDSKGPSSALYSQKQRLLVFYNLLITKISYDSAHHATLREIGITEYQRYSYRIMTLLHEKRQHLLKSTKDLKPQLRKQIQNYQQIFYKAIKQSSEMHSPLKDLRTELQQFRDLLKKYTEFEMLHKGIQYFLLLLLLLYNYEKGFVSTDYIYTIVEKEKNNKMSLGKLEELTKKNLDYK